MRPSPSPHEAVSNTPAVVSLFSGAGGLDLGFRQAGFPVRFALDQSEAAVATHRHNFRGAAAHAADIVQLGPLGLLRLLEAAVPPGTPVGVLGGPPCQGFSRANNGRGANDPRNTLALLYVDVIKAIAQQYPLEFVIFENVPEIRAKRHSGVFDELTERLGRLELSVHVANYFAQDFGVPQKRERVVIAALKQPEFKVRPNTGTPATVRDAIEHLPPPIFFRRGLSPSDVPFHENHWTMQPRSRRFAANDTVPTSRSFKRLRWDEPSPTVAYGNREIHVHPDGTRRLSVYEAMLLQGFPQDFVLKGNLSEQVEQVSNAVPPPLARAIARAIKSGRRNASRAALCQL